MPEDTLVKMMYVKMFWLYACLSLRMLYVHAHSYHKETRLYRVIYRQTHLKLLLLISSEAPAGNCCMLIVIILQPPPDSFDLCSKCVFNKSARGEGRKEEQQKDIRGEMRWESRHDRMRCWLSVVVEDKAHFSFLFYSTKHCTEKKRKTHCPAVEVG